MHPDARTSKLDLGLAPIDLRCPRGRVDLRDEHLTDPQPQLAATLVHVLADGHLRDVSTMLIDQPPPDPLRGCGATCAAQADRRSTTHRPARENSPSFGAGRFLRTFAVAAGPTRPTPDAHRRAADPVPALPTPAQTRPHGSLSA